MMWFRNLFETLIPRSTRRMRRAAARQRPATGRPLLEHLEDRSVPSFTPAVHYPTAPGYAPSAESGDFNGDGRLDLVTTAYGGGVSVLLNQGGGTFGTAANYDAGPSPGDVSVDDFNSDGKLDLATAITLETDRSVGVLLGNGDGTFGAVRKYAISSVPQALAAGDFNGDGRLDLVTANSGAVEGGATLSVLIGNGDGTFRNPTNVPTSGTRPGHLATGDFNGDGRLDLLVGEQSGYGGSSYVRLGNGDGTFRAPTWGTGGSVVAVADFNADGNLDLVGTGTYLYTDSESAPYQYDLVYVTLGRGDGTFSAGFSSDRLADGIAPFERTGVAAADFNGDGRPDFAVTHPATNLARVFINEGNGHFIQSSASPVGANPRHVLAGDWSGDGRADLAVTQQANSGTSPNTVAVLLNDGIWLPHLTIEGATVIEGHDGTTNAVFTVRLSSDPAQPVTVDYGTLNGSATVGADYLATSGTLTFSAGGPLTQTITVPVLGDRVAEGSSSSPGEWFYMTLTNADGAFLQSGMAEGRIRDDEPLVSISRPVFAEGDADTTDAVFTLTLSAPSATPVTVDYATFDLDPNSGYEIPLATAGSDYLATSGTVTFPVGSTTQTVRVPILGDTAVEGDEYFGLRVNSSQAHTDPNYILGEIVDDEVFVSVDPVSITERNAGTVSAVFTAHLSHARNQPVTVNFSTADGSATAGSDYVATSGTLTFAPGETTKTITVLVKGDRLPEPNETFVINLSNPTNATISIGQAQGTITDDEPRISISDVSKSEGKNGKTTLFTFTVSQSVAYDQPVTVSFRTVNGTATTSNSDYVAGSGTITFAPGETTKTITIEVKGDSKRESNEYFYLDLFGNSGNALFTKNRGIGTILNDD